MREAGLPLGSLFTVDEDTQITVRLEDGVPQLLIFTPDAFGGSALRVWPAGRPTASGGQVGRASSFGWKYLFGAGQGPLGQVVADSPDARTAMVNPAIDGWVIVIPTAIGTDTLPWRLIDPNGVVMFESVGLGLPDAGLQVDEDTWALVEIAEGTAELLVYTTNPYGGADLRVTPADRTTIDGGQIGTAVSPGYRYLFGAGQGPPEHVWDITVDDQAAKARVYNRAIRGWMIAVPDTVAIENLAWQLLDQDKSVVYRGVGLEGVSP